MTVQVFVAIIIAALANVASSRCYNQGTSKSDFEVQCSKNRYDFDNVKIICHSNDWTKWPTVKLNLSPDSEIQFENCTFPSTVEVLNILNSMKLPVITKTELKSLNGMLNRKSFKDLSVRDFRLIDSDFQELPFDLLYDVMNVRLFLISNTKLMDIPDSFFGKWAENITEVNLHHNRLQKIKKNDFSRLVYLTDLNLAYNQIAEIEPAAFEKLVNLDVIDLTSNRLRTLPVGIFQRTITLTWIDLSRNLFDELPQDLLANTKSLEEFTMDANNGTLSTLPDMLFGNLSNLQYVSLQHNHLKSVPSNLFTGCSKITSIYLSNNELTTLPSGLFDDTRELAFLRINNNRLETLPPHIFSKLNRLQRLSLIGNRLTSLMSEVLEGLQSVSEFHASNNNITRIDDQLFHYLKSASMIDLSYNRITFEGHQHAAETQDKKESSSINTSENKYVPVVTDGYNIRRWLLLDHNNIGEFNADVIKLLKYLHKINLSNNRISQIDLSGLPVEDMLRNSITFDGEVYLKINLQANPFHCDCDIKAFIDQLNGRNGTEEISNLISGSEYICASPPEMKGRLIKNIRPHELNCPLNTSDSPSAEN